MPLFNGFKVTFTLSGRRNKDMDESPPVVSIKGTYRTNTNEFIVYNRSPNPIRQISPSMVTLPKPTQDPVLRPNKSTSDLLEVPNENIPVVLRKSNPDVSMDPRGGMSKDRDSALLHKNSKHSKKDPKTQEKEKKKLEKQKQLEQKKREKIAAQEKAKAEKLRKEKEKADAQKQAKEEAKNKKDKKKTKVPEIAVQEAERVNPLARNAIPRLPDSAPPTQYSTNTLESSISRSSGPPPYSDIARPSVVHNVADNTGNTSFSKPINNPGSWDMVTQHRQQVARPVGNVGGRPKQMVMDLQYNVGNVKLSAPQTDADKDTEV